MHMPDNTVNILLEIDDMPHFFDKLKSVLVQIVEIMGGMFPRPSIGLAP